MRNARAKGKHIGRPPRTYLPQETRKAIAKAHTHQHPKPAAGERQPARIGSQIWHFGGHGSALHRSVLMGISESPLDPGLTVQT